MTGGRKPVAVTVLPAGTSLEGTGRAGNTETATGFLSEPEPEIP
jgi:hypothetical protein